MICRVVRVGVDDGELSHLKVTGYPHGLAMQNDVHESIQCCLGGFVE